MRIARLLVVPAVASLCALALAGAAVPAGTRTTLEVLNLPTTPNAGANVELAVKIASGTAATQRVAIYAPPGYRANLAVPVGTKLGTAAVEYTAGASIVSADGSITTDDPARHTADPCAPGAHAAVWLVAFTLNGQPVTTTVYVDPATPDLAARAAYVLQACFDTPTASGRGLSGIDLDLTRPFANPAGAGDYVWRALITPYGPGDVPNAAGVIEVQSLVPLPHKVVAKAVYDKKRHRIVVAGAVNSAGKPEAGAIVDFYFTPNLNTGKPKQIGSARATSKGVFTFTHAWPTSGYLIADPAELIFKPGDCEPTLGPAPCANETIAEGAPSIMKIAVPKAKKK